MIQLAFEPAFDPFHAAFRALRPMDLGVEPMPIARLKILDVYLVEPRRCLEIRLPSHLKKIARTAAKFQPATYGHRPSTNALFNMMGPMQEAAIQTLVMQGLFDGDAYSQDIAMRSEFPLADHIEARIKRANAEQYDLINFLYVELSAIPLNGLGGLKDRTGLGEFRYDVV